MKTNKEIVLNEICYVKYDFICEKIKNQYIEVFNKDILKELKKEFSNKIYNQKIFNKLKNKKTNKVIVLNRRLYMKIDSIYQKVKNESTTYYEKVLDEDILKELEKEFSKKNRIKNYSQIKN